MSLVHKSSENVFNSRNSQRINVPHRGSSQEAPGDRTPSFTPNFNKKEKLNSLSPQEIAGSFDRGDKHSAFHSSNTKESRFLNANKSRDSYKPHRFSDMMNSNESEDWIHNYTADDVINAHMEAAIDCYNRKIKQKALRSLLLHRVTEMQRNIVGKIGCSHYRKALLNKSFEAIFKNTHESKVEKTENYKSDQYFRIKTLRRFLRAWRITTKEVQNEDKVVRGAQERLDYRKKLAVMLKWKECMLHTQVKKAQIYTAAYLYKKSLTRRAFEALKMSHNHFRKEQLKEMQALQFERIKLLTTAFKMLQWYKNKKKKAYQFELKIESAYNYFAKKRCFHTFIIN